MKKTIFIFVYFVCYLLPLNFSFAQNTHFESVSTVVSSSSYDYKNPTFDTRLNDYNQFSWLAYERYKPTGGCDIVVRKTDYSSYGPEIVITSSTGDSNINPCIYDKIMVWVSNKDGNKNIYYSVCDGSTWTSPLLIPGSTLLDEAQPFIANNNFITIYPTHYFLTFKRGDDIYLKKFSIANSSWSSEEYNLTAEINQECSMPVVLEGYTYFSAVYLRKYSESYYTVSVKQFDARDTSIITLHSTFDIPGQVSPVKMKLSHGAGDLNPSVTFVDAGKKSIKILTSLSPPATSTISYPISLGMEFSSGKGVNMGIIRQDEMSCTAFGCIVRTIVSFDSNFVALCSPFSTSSLSNEVKYFNAGDISSKTSLDLSPPLFGNPYFKIRAVWEKKINGKSALVESYMTQMWNAVTNIGVAVKYSLSQNYPNPFNPTTFINYEVPVSDFVSLKVFNSLGKEVAVMVNERQSAGSYRADFDGNGLSSGIYFYTLKAGNFTETKKMLLIK